MVTTFCASAKRIWKNQYRVIRLKIVGAQWHYKDNCNNTYQKNYSENGSNLRMFQSSNYAAELNWAIFTRISSWTQENSIQKSKFYAKKKKTTLIRFVFSSKLREKVQIMQKHCQTCKILSSQRWSYTFFQLRTKLLSYRFLFLFLFGCFLLL